MPGWPESPSRLYNLDLLFLGLVFTPLSGSRSHLLFNSIYTDLRPLCVISQLSAGWPPLFCPQLQTDLSNQHRASLIITLDKWASVFIFFLITGRDSNTVGSSNLVAWTSLHVIYFFQIYFRFSPQPENANYVLIQTGCTILTVDNVSCSSLGETCNWMVVYHAGFFFLIYP